MQEFLTLKRVVEVDDRHEALQFWLRRHRLGISGIIFPSEIEIPNWTEQEKALLARHIYQCKGSGEQGVQASPYRPPVEEWARVAGDVPQQILNLSLLFNRSPNDRVVRFILDDDLDEETHRDETASEGWVHVHGKGEGMEYYSPAGYGPEKLEVKLKYNRSIVIDEEHMAELVQQGRVEAKRFKPGQAMIFDQNMVHKSGRGDRFRIAGFG